MVGCTIMPSGSEAPGSAVPAPMTEHFQVRQLRHPMKDGRPAFRHHPDSLASFLASHHGAAFSQTSIRSRLAGLWLPAYSGFQASLKLLERKKNQEK